MRSVKGLFIFSIVLLVMMVISLTSPVLAAEENTQAKKIDEQTIKIKNPATDLWRAVRQREFSGAEAINSTSQIKTPNAGSLINTEGNKWRQLRREKVIPYSAYFITGVVGLLLFLLIIIRRVKIPNGRSGKLVPRMTMMQRISHWLMALLVGFMALTGLLLLFGRLAIIPLIGAEAFSPMASASKEGHNLFGPLVIISIFLMLIYFIRHNWPAKFDFKWLLTAGGLFSRRHLKIGFFNAGEKILFWATIILCIVLSVTGLLLLFPYYEETVKLTQLALVVHAIAALLLIALALGHVWMVRTVEGTLDAMTSGNVDENWAKAHHSEWHRKANAELIVGENSELTEAPQKGAYE